jgi:integrase/recombinase XerD
MMDLLPAAQDYLALRRRLGFSLQRAGILLPDFVGYVEHAGAPHITTELAVAWAMLPQAAAPAWWRERLGIVRGFARYLTAIDPATQVPPAGILSARRLRVSPYQYSQSDIAGLMHEARALTPLWRAVTYETLVGLLAITGLRLGEALGIDRSDVDLAGRLLVVARTKFDNPRQVPIHETTAAALRRYCQIRDQRWPRPTTPSFFVSARGARLGEATVHDNFRVLATRAGLEGHGSRRWPRPHDLRHSLAVRTLATWYRAGYGVEAKLPLLSTFLGHIDPADTYWYLQATPELLGVVGQRLERVLAHVLEDLS